VHFLSDVGAEIWFLSHVSMIAEPLIHYLRQLQAQGKTHVKVDDDARVLLRKFYSRAMGKPVSQPPARVAVPPPAYPQPSKFVAPQVQEPAPAQNVPVAQAQVQVSGSTEEEKLSHLKQQAKDWAPAKAVGGLRDTMVFSTGNPRAEIMLVGEAPGFDEERLLEPFSGKAGQKLDAILRAMGTDRKDVYLSNIVKFRPKMANQTTSNRKPTKQELSVWLPFIREEVKIVAPKVIIALGESSAQALLGLETSVGEMRGEFHQYEGIPLRVTYHPSYVLNDEATPEKRMLWLDMLSVMERLNMPISEKQRGYFAKQG